MSKLKIEIWTVVEDFFKKVNLVTRKGIILLDVEELLKVNVCLMGIAN